MSLLDTFLNPHATFEKVAANIGTAEHMQINPQLFQMMKQASLSGDENLGQYASELIDEFIYEAVANGLSREQVEDYVQKTASENGIEIENELSAEEAYAAGFSSFIDAAVAEGHLKQASLEYADLDAARIEDAATHVFLDTLLDGLTTVQAIKVAADAAAAAPAASADAAKKEGLIDAAKRKLKEMGEKTKAGWNNMGTAGKAALIGVPAAALAGGLAYGAYRYKKKKDGEKKASFAADFQPMCEEAVFALSERMDGSFESTVDQMNKTASARGISDDDFAAYLDASAEYYGYEPEALSFDEQMQKAASVAQDAAFNLIEEVATANGVSIDDIIAVNKAEPMVRGYMDAAELIKKAAEEKEKKKGMSTAAKVGLGIAGAAALGAGGLTGLGRYTTGKWSPTGGYSAAKDALRKGGLGDGIAELTGRSRFNPMNVAQSLKAQRIAHTQPDQNELFKYHDYLVGKYRPNPQKQGPTSDPMIIGKASHPLPTPKP